MQIVSQDYKDSMKLPLRNRGYIKATIGVYNHDAQKNIEMDSENTSTAYWSSTDRKIFDNYTVQQRYATKEKNYSILDGSMYFAPEQNEISQYPLYHNGIVTSGYLGSVKLLLGDTYDIKGLTINFGNSYPTRLSITTDNGTVTYNNSSNVFVTEDVFNDISYIIITPLAMLNGSKSRFRIEKFYCGIANAFDNYQVLKCNFKEYVSSISDTLPSQDLTLVVDNVKQYYSPNNENSTLAFMELGQEITIEYGYDVSGDGDIEWVQPFTAYLKTWEADDTQAQFTATDIFDYKLNGTYDKGVYYPNGISLYDLAIAVLTDAGITDTREYSIDGYLQNVIVKNPLPKCKHGEALQIIANTGRCTLFTDRNKRICLKTSFVPDSTITTNSLAQWGDLDGITDSNPKNAYAEKSNGFSVLDGSLKFYNYEDLSYQKYPISVSDGVIDFDSTSDKYLTTATYDANTGYLTLNTTTNQSSAKDYDIKVSGEKLVIESPSDTAADLTNIGYVSNDTFVNNTWNVLTPRIDLTFENAWTFYGLSIDFKNIYPTKIRVYTYKNNVQLGYTTYNCNSLHWSTHDEFADCDKVRVQFYKGSENARVHVDNLHILDVTDYTLTRDFDILGSSKCIRNNKIQTISVKKYLYNTSDEQKDLTSEKIVVNTETQVKVEFNNDSYGYTVTTDNANITAVILESSAHYAIVKLTCSGTQETTYTVKGYEYSIEVVDASENYENHGEIITWKNPLVSNDTLANDVREWLASYYLGQLNYEIAWRGDPRTDANDLFYLETASGGIDMIRAYQNELKFDGAWQGTIKGRVANISWL